MSLSRPKAVWIILFIAIFVSIALIYLSTPRQTKTAIPEPKQEVNALTFYHWWTSPGERAAIDALVDVFVEKYPDIAVMPSSVIAGKSSGGGGIELLNIIEPMILAGEAPDAFQMNGGYSARRFFEKGFLKQIDYIWESDGLKNVVPSVIQNVCKFEGHYYAVPVNAHRTNVVWYNNSLLEENNINPDELTTWEAFFDACDKLREGGVEYPIQIGPAWTVEMVFSDIAVSNGLDFYQDFINGKIVSADNEELLRTFEMFKTYLSYANPDSANLTWDETTKRIINGEGAFNIMGDWANGEFEIGGMIYGKDYGTFTTPGTEGMYEFCVDTFLRPKGVAHPENSDKWLKVVGSQEGQDAFNPIKGSIPARTDINVNNYSVYQQSAISDFWQADHMYPHLSNGVPKSFEIAIQNVISQFIRDPDVNQAADLLVDYTKKITSEFTMKWVLE